MLRVPKKLGFAVEAVIDVAIHADAGPVNSVDIAHRAGIAERLGADSLDSVELVMAFEEEFGCEIPDAVAEKIVTVKDAVSFLEGA